MTVFKQIDLEKGKKIWVAPYCYIQRYPDGYYHVVRFFPDGWERLLPRCLLHLFVPMMDSLHCSDPKIAIKTTNLILGLDDDIEGQTGGIHETRFG